MLLLRMEGEMLSLALWLLSLHGHIHLTPQCLRLFDRVVAVSGSLFHTLHYPWSREASPEFHPILLLLHFDPLPVVNMLFLRLPPSLNAQDVPQ